MQTIVVPEIVPYLLAILALLLLWEFHSIRRRAGQAKTVDAWSQSGIRLFVCLTPDETTDCPACRQANNIAFAPALAAEKKFGPQSKQCANPDNCRSLRVGLHGSWPEALDLQRQLQRQGSAIRLSPQEMDRLIEGAKAQRGPTPADKVSIRFLRAMRTERHDPKAAAQLYREVIAEAQTTRDQEVVVPAYLRLTEVLERTRQFDEALAVVDQFLAAYAGNASTPHGPTQEQLSVQSLRKSRLSASTRSGEKPVA